METRGIPKEASASIKIERKKQIQQALAKLALAGMVSVNRFRIEQEIAIEQMEEEWFNLSGDFFHRVNRI